MPDLPTTCPTCNGAHPGQGTCEDCMGQGSLPVKGIGYHLKKLTADTQDQIADVMDKCNDILEKCNEILAEVQGS